MKKPLHLTTLLAVASSPLALLADEAQPKKQLLLPFLLEQQVDKKQSQAFSLPTPSESLGDYCDHEALSS